MPRGARASTIMVESKASLPNIEVLNGQYEIPEVEQAK